MKLKKFIRVPMVLTSWTTGILVAANTLFIKSGTEILKIMVNSPDPVDASSQMYISFALGLACVLVQLRYLNSALKYFRQVEVMPIFQSSIIMNSMAAGLFVLEESKFYSTLDLCVLATSAVITVIGVAVIMKKSEGGEQLAKSDDKVVEMADAKPPMVDTVK
mmetsp:Transcript_1215/g.1509  ORF Transcript_1215/g.1509 Transcript_1215/m.1509 type:complete len:163 (+) Transcript_1215:768-1256(+)